MTILQREVPSWVRSSVNQEVRDTVKGSQGHERMVCVVRNQLLALGSEDQGSSPSCSLPLLKILRPGHLHRDVTPAPQTPVNPAVYPRAHASSSKPAPPTHLPSSKCQKPGHLPHLHPHISQWPSPVLLTCLSPCLLPPLCVRPSPSAAGLLWTNASASL